MQSQNLRKLSTQALEIAEPINYNEHQMSDSPQQSPIRAVSVLSLRHEANNYGPLRSTRIGVPTTPSPIATDMFKVHNH
jgi:hypothetical protein